MILAFNLKHTTAISVFLLLVYALKSNAQSMDELKTIEPSDLAEMLTSKMDSALMFNSTQRDKVYLINLDFAKQAGPVLKSDSSKIKKATSIKSFADKRDESLKIVLSDQQYVKFEEFKAQNRKRLRNEYKSRQE